MKPPRRRPARSSALSRAPIATILTATAVAGAVALSGCQMMSPMQTVMPYQPADGVAVDLGDVQVRDLVVIASAKGGPGALSAMVVNKGKQPVKVTFTLAAGAVTTTEIPPGTQTRLSGLEGTPAVSLPTITAAPGGIVKLTVSTPAGGAPEVAVPVMLPHGPYATITPEPSPSTPSPSATATASPTA